MFNPLLLAILKGCTSISDLTLQGKLTLPNGKESGEASCTTPMYDIGFYEKPEDGAYYRTNDVCDSSVHASSMNSSTSSVYFKVEPGVEVKLNESMTLNSMWLFCTDDLTNPLASSEAPDSEDTADTIDPLSCRENTSDDTGETHDGDCSPFELTALHACGDSILENEILQLSFSYQYSIYK